MWFLRAAMSLLGLLSCDRHDLALFGPGQLEGEPAHRHFQVGSGQGGACQHRWQRVAPDRIANLAGFVFSGARVLKPDRRKYFDDGRRGDAVLLPSPFRKCSDLAGLKLPVSASIPGQGFRL
jgi:hypothetical protein